MADNMLADLKKHDAHPSVLSFMESHRAAIELRPPDSFTADEVRGSQIQPYGEVLLSRRALRISAPTLV